MFAAITALNSSSEKRNHSIGTTEKLCSSPAQRPIWQKITATRDWREDKDSGKSKPLREGKSLLEIKKRVHLDPYGKSLLATLRRCTSNLTGKKNPSSKFSSTKDLAHAFGVGVSAVKSCPFNEEHNNGGNKRKQRLDARETIFNSDRKRKQYWTAR
jgi:hypothetical protein